MLKKSNTVLGPDGKVLNLFNSTSRNDSPARSTEEHDVPLTCQVCNLPFETQKTLKLHLEMKHLPSTYVYQCPTCTQKFSSSAAVLRHLSDDHKYDILKKYIYILIKKSIIFQQIKSPHKNDAR
jgi:uncharacterized C2H2 Zn-finger protein